MTDKTYTVLCPFGGSSGGALGFMSAEVRLLGYVGRFRCIGSIDNDPIACADFERLTRSRALCTNIETMTADELLAFAGDEAPDVVFMSPPCKGASRLLGAAKADTEKYRAMNRLALAWVRVMLAAWGDAPPKLLLLENVPGLPRRAAEMMTELRAVLRRHGYSLSEGFHCCGEIGGLGQRRKRFLLVARQTKRCPPTLFKPLLRRVRSIGEVIGVLPIPTSPAASEWGDHHVMPRLSWRNWKRLALIPAGGDWRDLEGVLAKGQARRERFRRHAVAQWAEPTKAVTGPGGHAVEAVADPRGADGPSCPDAEPDDDTDADGDGPDLGHPGDAGMVPADRPGNWSTLGVIPFDQPAPTISAQARATTGAFSVADPRPFEDPRATDPKFIPASPPYDAAYGVVSWGEPARTVAGQNAVGCGAYAAGDPRPGALAVRRMTLEEAMRLELRPDRPPPFVPFIEAEDGTWHRPLTLLELAILQGYPLRPHGVPLHFGGTRGQVAEHIGNSVPPPAARPIAEQMLVALVQATAGTWGLSTGGGVWVRPRVSDRSDTYAPQSTTFAP